jgi:hypothetical protein
MAEHEGFPGMSQPPPMQGMMKLLLGMFVQQSISVAARLGIADLLKDGAKPVAELAQETGTHPQALYRLLRALASVGVFTEGKPREFGLTPMASLLQSGVPGSLRGFSIFISEPWYHAVWDELLHSVQTGESAFVRAWGMTQFDYYKNNPHANRILNDAMTSVSAVGNAAVTAAYDFSAARWLIDVGGGNGGLITSILQANPALNGVLFDQLHVIEGARKNIDAAQLTDRCKIIAGDFFESIPEGGDLYIMQHVIHDWDDERAALILKNCRRAVLVEYALPEGNEPSMGKFIDIAMLAVSDGGRERTQREFSALFTGAGFRLTRLIPTRSPNCIIEAVPI